MKKRLFILLGLVLSIRVLATNVEQNQRFLYYFYEAERLWQAEQYNDAFQLFKFCYTLKPEDAMTNLYLGHIYRAMDEPALAIKCYKTAWQSAPAACWKDYAVTLYKSGEAYRGWAIDVMEQTCVHAPKDANLWENLRDAYLGVGNYKKALTAQDKLDQIEGFDAYSAISRYRIYTYMHQPKKAIAEIDRYLEDDPKNLQFLFYRMQLYEQIGVKAKKMIPIYQEILSMDPYNALVLNNYAYLLATHKGDLIQAETMSAKAVQIESNNPTYLDTYAWILYLSGQKELAKIYIRQTLNLLQDKTIPQEIQQHYKTIYLQ